MDARFLLKLIFITVLTHSNLNGSCKVIHITPEKEHSCPQNIQMCYTLSEIAENTTSYISSNTAMIFSPGNHTVDGNVSIVITNASNIALDGNGSSIRCARGFEVGFVFIKITNLSVLNLHLHHCGAFLPSGDFVGSPLTRYFENNASPSLYISHVTDITISKVYIYNSTGAGLLGLNLMGNCTISQSVFIENNPNCKITFTKAISMVQKADIYIHHSKFLFGKSRQNQASGFFPLTAGLNIITKQTSYNISMNISNVTAHYSDILFQVGKCQKSHIAIHLDAISCSHSQTTCLEMMIRSSSDCRKCVNVNISQSYFSENFEALSLFSIGNLRSSGKLVTFGDVTLDSITLYNNSLALYIDSINAILNNVNFTQNARKIRAPIEIAGCYVRMMGTKFIENRGNAAAIMVSQQSRIYFYGNTIFLRNRGERAGAIFTHTSYLFFENSLQFIENEGYDGGAIAFYEEPSATKGYGFDYYSLNIAQNVTVNFTRNHARHHGGALYINKSENYMYIDDMNIFINSPKTVLKCFYKPKTVHIMQGGLLTVIKNSSLVFTNNTSVVAGSAIYGGWVQQCFIQEGFSFLRTSYPGSSIFKQLFRIITNSSDLSPVSSDPVRVCICSNSKPECFNASYTVEVHPGEIFQISAVGVGQMFGTVPSTIHAQFRQKSTIIRPNFDSLQRVQKAEQFCTYLSFTVKSPNAMEDIVLTVDTNVNKNVLLATYAFATDQLFANNAVIHVKLKPCPVGFILSESVCICHPQLQALTITCYGNTGKVLREPPLWINATFINGTPHGFLVHQNCPFDYCKPYRLNLSLENPDCQCAFNRSGILCGSCQENFSQVLGSSNCKPCSNLWLLLFIPVGALAGIVLVAFLMLLNLTVSVGTINGLIFYANIIKLSQTVFFPNNNNQFLSWFIAWVNLDLGLEACFYNGMNAYTRTWLQFIFPVYIWLIVIAIIVSSHYSTKAAKLCGRNSVQVLATLFLLSYSKLLRLTVTIFSFTTLEYPDGLIRRVWLYDGNVDYLKGQHIPLFVAALLVLLVLSLPYTTLLLFIQCLQQKSKYRVLFWIGRFKPLFDAYTGPYKDTHCYWTGLLLLIRIVLLLAFAMNVFGDPATNLLTIIITISCLFFYLSILGCIYKNRFLSILECSFFLNIIILCTVTLYSRPNHKNQVVLTNASVGIAFIIFCAIVLYHTQSVVRNKCFHQRSQLSDWISVQVRKLMLKYRDKSHNQERLQHVSSGTADSDPQQPVPSTFIELRESLLEYCEQN